MEGKKQVIRLLARNVGKISNFFDEHSVWKCFISNAYRYENEKCDIYNKFLKDFIKINTHFCPIKSKKKNLRNELIKYLRKHLKNDEDFYNLGFTAMRHLGRIKNSILQLDSQANIGSDNIWSDKTGADKIGADNNDNRYTFYSNLKNINYLMNKKQIWACEDEKNMFKNNIHIIDIKKLNENYDNNNIKIYGKTKKKKKKKHIKNDDMFLQKSKRLTQVLKNCINKNNTITNNEHIQSDDKTQNISNLSIFKSGNGQNEIKKGTILISHPLTSNTLWNKSVIIITHKDKNNIVYGLILNKHPLYNNNMCLSKEKQINKILNNLYSKKKKKKKNQELQDNQNDISDHNSNNKNSKQIQKNIQPSIEKDQKSIAECSNVIETDKTKVSDNTELVATNQNLNNAIVPNLNETNENTNDGKYDDFPTLKDLQEMFLRIQFRTTSKQFVNKKNIKNNNLFILMDEHLLDIITHYIIKLNKVPLYLRFLPSYNIGSMTDIKCEIKKLEFLNEFYKIYFEKYNKWKVVIINNRIHIFDKEKEKEKKNKNQFQNKLSLKNSNTIRQKDNTEKTDKHKLTEKEKEKIHRKIQKFRETNQLTNDDDQLEKDKPYPTEKKNKKQLLRTRAKQQMCEDEEEDDEEEDDEDDEDEEYEEDDEEDEEDDEEDEEDDDDDENDSVVDIDKQTFEKLKNEINTKRKEQNKISSSIEKIKSKSVNKNYYPGNPVNLFWLGGPLPGLTILHNIKKLSKNIIINDVLYEGYNDDVNSSSLNEHNIFGKTNYELNDDNIQTDTNNDKLTNPVKTDKEEKDIEIKNEENENTDCEKKTKLIKRFIGKATWDLNQLIEELNNDYWIPINCDNKELLSKIIFNTTSEGNNNNENEQMASSDMFNTYQGENLWEKILSSLNSDYENISKIPQYVIDNILKDFKHAENE
ncbi:uncharacterized protein PY17X_1022600 [Plasmodium yoelii]|nr:uncharacterized protein PY17X_1022600 [Plasmodium yoelii]VTZ78956.1 conserved Plasmodium protein, unknown function [Plasmodium yoelii]|eukprot:XP_729654.3 uncharacterized protein PY17X_1022600 [Plasmodium yoelii]